MIDVALRAAGAETAGAISWVASGLYCVAAQGVAYASVIEIGPNLLAAITSLIGAGVLFGQAYLATKLRRIDEKAREAHEVSQENRERIEAVEENGQ